MGAHIPSGEGVLFGGTYLGMPKIARGRYTQSYSQGAAAMRPLAVVNAATCNVRVMV